MDLDVLVTTAIGVITAAGGGTFSWFTAKKKYKAEVEANNITNMQESLEFYKNISENNKKVLTDLQEENEDLRKENTVLKNRLDESEDNVRTLQNENDILKEEVKQLIIKISSQEERINKLEALVKDTATLEQFGTINPKLDNKVKPTTKKASKTVKK